MPPASGGMAEGYKLAWDEAQGWVAVGRQAPSGGAATDLKHDDGGSPPDGMCCATPFGGAVENS